MHSSHEPRTSRARGGRLVLLGSLLLFAFLLPVVNVERDFATGETNYEIKFVNIDALGGDEVPTELQLFMLFPGVAGIAVILLAILVPAPMRSLGLILVGVIGLVLMLLVLDRVRQDEIQGMLLTGFGGRTWAVLIGMIATVFLLGGTRARWVEAGSRPAATLAGVGGGLTLLGYVLPSMPDDGIAAGVPFDLVGQDHTRFIGIVALLGMAMVIAAAILALVNLKRRTPTTESKLGNASFWLFLGSMLLLFIAVWIAALDAVGDAQEGMTIPLTLAVLKWACLAMGIVLLTPLGVSDLLVVLHRTAAEAKVVDAVSKRLEILDKEKRVRRRIHELELLRDEGHMTVEEFEERKQTLEDML